MRLKRYKRKKFSDYLSWEIVLIIISLVSAFLVISYFAKRVDKILVPMAEIKTRKFITEIINNATLEVDFSGDLININKDENDEIKLVNYNSFDNKYTKINKDNLHKFLNNKLLLSYSSLDNYNKCAFRYYLSNILRLNIFEETFYTVLGNLFHYVLSNYFKDGFNMKELYKKYLDNCSYQFDDREVFFLNYLEDELEFIINTIIKQNETNSLFNILAEEKIQVDKSFDNWNIIFKGFVDKIMFNDDNSIVSIVDYKTGNPKLNLNNVIYGLDLQLPVYIYLVKKKFPDARIAGFYLQKILNNEIVKDFKHSYLDLKGDKLKLQGYSNSSINVLEQFDSSYSDSKVIKGMKMSSKGISSKKILDDVMIDKLSSITEDKIDEAINGIVNAKFDINPKRVGMDNVGCSYCEFRDICFMKEKMVNNLKEYKNMEFLGGDDDDTN